MAQQTSSLLTVVQLLRLTLYIFMKKKNLFNAKIHIQGSGWIPYSQHIH